MEGRRELAWAVSEPVSRVGAMPWKPVVGQAVIARLDGQVRELVVMAWDSITGDVKVAWPPQNAAIVSRHRYSTVRTTQIAKSRYEPLDPDGFGAATRGTPVVPKHKMGSLDSVQQNSKA
jgi:hypothetical protein